MNTVKKVDTYNNSNFTKIKKFTELIKKMVIEIDRNKIN